jgi:hypothetical protein
MNGKKVERGRWGRDEGVAFLETDNKKKWISRRAASGAACISCVPSPTFTLYGGITNAAEWQAYQNCSTPSKNT